MISVSLLPYRFKSAEPLNPALQNKWHWLMDVLRPFGLEKYAIGWLDFHVFDVSATPGSRSHSALASYISSRSARRRRGRKKASCRPFPRRGL